MSSGYRNRRPGGSGSSRGRSNPREEKRGGVSPFSDVLKTFLRESGMAAHVSRAAVHQAWREACGPEFARHTRIVAFRNGELVVEVESSAHFQELKSFTGDQFVQLANSKLGAPRIRRASFKLKR